MKLHETMLNTLPDWEERITLTDEEIGDEHISTSVDTPMRADAFAISDEERRHALSFIFAR